MKRLSTAALESVSSRTSLALPPEGWKSQQVGIVHLELERSTGLIKLHTARTTSD